MSLKSLESFLNPKALKQGQSSTNLENEDCLCLYCLIRHPASSKHDLNTVHRRYSRNEKHDFNGVPTVWTQPMTCAVLAWSLNDLLAVLRARDGEIPLSEARPWFEHPTASVSIKL